MVHKPKHKVHSFRGLLADGGQDEINLERQNVNLAYRIIKLQLFPSAPGVTVQESVVKVFKEEQDSVTGTVDFTDTNLLGAAFQRSPASVGTASGYTTTIFTIFDNNLFSRNIYITHDENAGTSACNYYLEIEEVPVTASTLMQIKLGTARRLGGSSMGN